MVEMVPKDPMDTFLYAGEIHHVLKNMYIQVGYCSGPKSKNQVLSLPFFPKMGSRTFVDDLGFEGMTSKEIIEKNEVSRSPYMSDEIINRHPRFPTFTQNVR